MRAWLLFLHRWLALIAALPLLVIFATGLILAVEPVLQTVTIAPGELTAAKLHDLLGRFDPNDKARGINYRSYDHTLSIGDPRSGETLVDVRNGEVLHAPGTLATALDVTRKLHRTFLVEAKWLVTTSSFVMLILAALGLLMGWPRITRSLSGWHKAMAWWLLPFVILAPLTGILMVNGITLAGVHEEKGDTAASAPSLAAAIDILAREHDLSGLMQLRLQRGRVTAKVIEAGEPRSYGIGTRGVVPLSRNWPRLWHEGNLAAPWTSIIPVVTALALLGLLGTGLWIWSARQFRRRRVRGPARAAAVAPAE
jgi:uncharacterized iron-regulated membrane protein